MVTQLVGNVIKAQTLVFPYPNILTNYSLWPKKEPPIGV